MSGTSTLIGYADGSALGNPGPAGWAVILEDTDGSRVTLSGGLSFATNNQAEITAATEALTFAPADVPFVLFLDSQYVIKGATLWRSGWEARGWKNSAGRSVANRGLWEKLHAALDARPLAELQWVRGHAGNALNEAVDWSAPTEWSDLIVSALSASGPFARRSLGLVAGIAERCAA